jgi:hypothetical protein
MACFKKEKVVINTVERDIVEPFTEYLAVMTGLI